MKGSITDPFFIPYYYNMLEYNVMDLKNQIDSDYLGEKIYNLLDVTFVIPESYIYDIFEVTNEYIARPDLISYDAYGDTSHADIICKLNGISNPFELDEGMKLIIPSPENIMDFYLRPEIENEEILNAPIIKTKQSKRQANESIIGDTRFKIDSSTGIIIY